MNAQNRFYGITLLAIIVISVFARLPGVHWLTDAAPYPGYSFHPDDLRFLIEVENFRESKPWRGYVRGMAAHLYVVKTTLDYVSSEYWDPSILIRLISLFYGVLTIILTALMVRSWSYPPKVALTTTALLAITPLHVINSHFGTADVTATFYFYLALLLGWYYLKTKRQVYFLSFTAAIGACLAIKFFLSLLVPLALVLWLEEKGRRLDKTLTAILSVIFSFSVFNFFNYTPWDFYSLLVMLLFDNIWVPGGKSPLGNLILYIWETIFSLGLGIWILFIAGVVFKLTRLFARLQANAKLSNWKTTGREAIRSPYAVYWSAFLTHGALILSADLHAVRHMVAFIPLACFIAAFGFWEISSRLKAPAFVISTSLSFVLVYQIYDVIRVEKLYSHDLRNEMAAWIKANTTPDDAIGTHQMSYALVAGVQVIEDIEDKMNNGSAIGPDYFVTCDLGYNRYFSSDNADNIFHASGGQERLDFYRNLFEGRLDYEVTLDLVQKPFSLEQRLKKKGVLLSGNIFTPERCLVFKRTNAGINESLADIRG